ncbi:hypothetical protein JCM3263A_05500 [Thermobifida fusca]
MPPQAADAAAASPDGLPPDASIYGQYGTAGQQWHTIRESCVDKLSSSAMATLSNTAWDLSKTINQSTITVYQAATSDGLLDNFNRLVENVIGELREGIWRPLLPTVIILGAVWLGWYGLIRKRVTLTIESAVWMVVATTLGIWILVNPGQILGYAGTIVNSGGQLINSSLSKVNVPGGTVTCPAGAPDMEKAEWESANDFAVRQNSQMLWSGLVCRPWIAGEFGTGPVANVAARYHAMDLLEAQGVSRLEQYQIANGEIDAAELYSEKQASYEEISANIKNAYPEVYPIFEGSQQGIRLGVASLALFASIFAGGVILVGSVALIVLKIGFLLLLLLAPIFLLIGVHPGYGRTVLVRWFELLLGLLLKQIFVVLLIALLVMCYGLVMATDLGWGLQMILLALFTVALFIYRKPFANLFASVNANTFTSRMVNDALNSRVLAASANVLPPVAYMKAQKWGLDRAPQLAAGAAALPAGAAATAGAAAGADAAEAEGVATATEGDNEGATATESGGRARARGVAGYGRTPGKAAPPPLNLDGSSKSGGASRAGVAPQRDSSQAPRLSTASSASSSLFEGTGGGGAIPPRPAGGYTGVGDTGWSSVFGTGSSGNAHRAEAAPRASKDAAPPRADSSASGTGLFGGRTETPPQGSTLPRPSRWAGPGTRGEKRTPPPARPAPAPSSSEQSSGEGGTWLSGSRKDKDAPISPFWAEGAGRRDRTREVPFWLDSDD